jgi:hypothetical protein
VNPVGRHPERGLALLLVVTLLALVTLLVVSFAIITRVETQVSSTVVDKPGPTHCSPWMWRWVGCRSSRGPINVRPGVPT